MSEPFLPEPEAPLPPTKQNAKRVVLLWAVLIAMFLSIWQILSPSPAAHPHGYAQPPSPCTDSSSTAWVYLPMVFMAALTFLLLRIFRQNNTFQLAGEPGRLALAYRRFPDAVTKLKRVVPQFARQPVYRAASLLNLAEAQMRVGSFDDAIASCAQAERARTLQFGVGLRIHLACLTALLYALRGNVTLAEHWIANGRAQLAKNVTDDRIGFGARLVMAQAFVAARKNDDAGALNAIDASWLELSFGLSHATMKLVEVLRAFVEAQGGLREANTVAERLVRIEPVVPGELAFLGVEWPEMRAFLQAHGIN